MNGKGYEDWDSEGLLRLVRSLQPQIIVNNRMGLTETADGWDFVTPEQFLHDASEIPIERHGGRAEQKTELLQNRL
jgi:hypothetical protein